MNKTAFIKLTESKNKDDLEQAIKEGLDLNKPFEDDSWPLFVAIEKRNFYFASWCVELGAKTDILDSNGCSPLVKCYEVNDGPYLTHEFIQVGIKPFINPLTINAVGEYGISALIFAIYLAQPKEVKLLLDNGANVNEIITSTKNYNCHRSALLLASFPEESVNTKLESKNGTKVVKELIKYKPDPNTQDKKVDSVFPLATPLMKACMERNYGIAKEILKLKNIDWELKESEGYSTFTFICKTNQKDLILKAYQCGQKHINLEEVIQSRYYDEMSDETKSLIEKLKLEKTILAIESKRKTKKI